ncbi:Ig-like domain repeat protein [Aeromicrobium sp. UC242_57]|uniref:Ig-like domain repeat protein n=1 Tax=Aeromicrobium sp. UC242_57 TaxID=3374624 RepID=UPI0037A9F057
MPSENGPRLPSTPQTVQVVVGLDAANPTGPSTTDGCTTLSNAAAVSGKWVYLDRGTCTFATKASNVKAAGGTGMLVSSGAGTPPFGPTGNAAVPAVMISQDRGDAIKSVPTGTPITVTVTGNDPTGVASDRWLVGEQATATPGALRDMWNPTCKGDPAKVTDAQYHCATSDSGGVHINSGVPNRAYSLAVDGGTFNGQTVVGLGLDKAAQIWWRAGASYLTPTSDFDDFASSLTQACTTLVAEPIKKLSLTGAPGEAAASVTTADCAQLAKVVTATELRTDPVARCGATARFTPGQPAGCGEGTTSVTMLEQDFDNGLADWSSTVTDPVGTSTSGPSSWTTTTKAAGIRGSAAFAANPYGTCSAADSLTGIGSLTSPSFTVPSTRGARATFRHTLAIEDSYDGGNVKISVNGGPFTVVPTSAYTFNAPDGVIGGQDNDNPMLGQQVWTGTEQQTTGARWGTSQIDLAATGVTVGDSIRIRFDLGTDICAGVHGWLVDDVAVTYCATMTSVAATAPTTWTVGSSSQLRVDVTSADSSAAAGDVEVRDSTGSLLGTATLADGSATVTLPSSVPVGTHQLTVAYLGNSVYARATVVLPVTVTARSATRLAATQPKPWIVGSTARVPVTATTAQGAPALGTVELRASSGHVLATATLTGGSATLTAPRTLKAGVQRLTVAYLGSTTSAPAVTTVSVTVRATSRTSLAVSPSKPRRGKAFTVRATVTSSPRATGKITFRLNGKSLGSATIKGGRATLKISAKKAKKLQGQPEEEQHDQRGALRIDSRRR